MKCRECADFLMDYASGELPAAQREEFERHLNRCPPCLRYLKSYEETIRLGKECCGCGGADAEIPEEMVRAIMEARKKPAE